MENYLNKTLSFDQLVAESLPLHNSFTVSAGAGRANEVLRADWQEHFDRVQQEIGFDFVRFHGLFHDDMFVLRDTYGGGFGPDAQLEESVYTYHYVDKVFDYLLSRGARPFVELGFMPRTLATQTETLFWWGAHCSPPKDMSKWCELVRKTIEHWIERYGIAEVSTWRFEVWNEPNLEPHFWTGSKTEYFELYEATVKTIKSIDERLLVGGPSTSVFVPDNRYDGEFMDYEVQAATAEAENLEELDWKPVWIPEFLKWCAERDLPVDFVTTHLYPTDYAFGSNGQGVALSRYADATRDDLLVLRDLISKSNYPDAEIHITEWSTSPSSRDFMHDTHFAACYVARAFANTIGLADSVSYWTFTDVFEEGGCGIGPFHGGFGMLNLDGVAKPMFHTFKMISKMTEWAYKDGEKALISVDPEHKSVAILGFEYPDSFLPRSVGDAHSHAHANRLAEYGATRQVAYEISGLAPNTQYELTIVDSKSGNATNAWLELGSPVNMTPAEQRIVANRAESLTRKLFSVDAQGTLVLAFEVEPWSVWQVSLAV